MAGFTTAASLRSSWDRGTSTVEPLRGGLMCLLAASTERSRVRRWKYSLARRRVEEGRGCTEDTLPSAVGLRKPVSPHGEDDLVAFPGLLVDGGRVAGTDRQKCSFERRLSAAFESWYLSAFGISMFSDSVFPWDGKRRVAEHFGSPPAPVKLRPCLRVPSWSTTLAAESAPPRLFDALPCLGASPVPFSTRPEPRARRRREGTFCRAVGGGMFSMSSWRASATLSLPLPLPLPLPLAFLSLFSGRTPIFGSRVLIRFKASLSRSDARVRLDVSSMCWDVTASSIGVSDGETALAGFGTPISGTLPTGSESTMVFVVG